MKKIYTLILVFTVGLFHSCSTNNDTSSGNNSVDYEFTITINGEVHKVKGNSSDGIPLASVGFVQNRCYASFGINGASVLLGINDVTSPNYISGQNMQVQIILPNPLLGTNQATISFTGNYFDTLATSLGSNYLGFMSVSSTLVTVNGVSPNNNIPIIITDLGTPTTLANSGSAYNFGQTIKGNYSGTIYLSRLVNGVGIFYDIPVPISINFKALRIN
jgi:hypothetical protein